MVFFDGLFVEIDFLVEPGTVAFPLGLHASHLLLLQDNSPELLVLPCDHLHTHLLGKAVGGRVDGPFGTAVLGVDVLLVTLVADGSEGAFGGIWVDAWQ